MKQPIAADIVTLALVADSAGGLAIRSLTDDASTSNAAVSPVKADSTTTPTPSPTATTTPTPTPTPTASPTATPAVTPSTPTTPALVPVEDLQITTGAVGPVQVGMTIAEAKATGYFEDDEDVVECVGIKPPLQFKLAYQKSLDFWLNEQSRIDAMVVWTRGPQTRSGLEVGSTYAEVKRVVGPDVQPEAAGYDQTGIFVRDGDAWIGFLLESRLEELRDDTKVYLIEVTRGTKPSLARHSC